MRGARDGADLCRAEARRRTHTHRSNNFQVQRPPHSFHPLPPLSDTLTNMVGER